MLSTTGFAIKASKGVARRCFATKSAGMVQNNSSWQEAKSNMVNGDLMPSSGIQSEPDKLNNAPFLNPNEKVGRQVDRKNQLDTEEFPRNNDVGRNYAKDNNLSGKKQFKKDDLAKQPSAPMNKYQSAPTASRDTKPVTEQQQQQKITESFDDMPSFGTPFHEYDDLRAKDVDEQQANAIKDALFAKPGTKGSNAIDFGKLQNAELQKASVSNNIASPSESKNVVDKSDYVSKWGSKDGLDIEPKWKRAAMKAAEGADETIPNSNANGIADTLIGVMKETMAGVSSVVIPAAESLGNSVSSSIDGMANSKTLEKAKEGFETLKTGVGKAAETVKESVAYAAESIPPMASNLMHKAEDLASQSKETLMNKVSDLSASATEVIKSKASDMSSTADALKSKASDLAASATSEAKKMQPGSQGSNAQLKDMEMSDTSSKKL